MTRICLIWLAMTMIAPWVWADPPASQTLPFSTQFRVIDFPPHEAGPLIPGWGGWRLPRGRAAVEPFSGPGESPALILQPQTVVQRPILAPDTPVVWVSTVVRTSGGSTTLADLPDRPLAAAVVFDAVSGLVALDGNGAGGGTPRVLGVPLDPDVWFHLAIRQDFEHQTYDVFAEGFPLSLGLGFRDHVPEFHGFAQGAGAQPSGLASVLVSTAPPPEVPYLPGDVRINGIINAGDLVRLVNHLQAGVALSNMERLNADIDRDGDVDVDDRELLIGILLGVEVD